MAGYSSPRIALLMLIALLALSSASVASRTRFVLYHHYEGLFLLHGEKGDLFQLQDDLFLGDGSRLIAGIDFDWLKEWWRERGHDPDEAYLTYEWDEKDGSGYVDSHFPGGRILLTNFSRYDDSYGLHTNGLFVGGALSSSAREDTAAHQSDTGMAWFDGQRWVHLWCNTNEGIASAVYTNHRYPPHQWTFLGSRVLVQSAKKLVLASAHLIELDQTRLRMERYAYFAAGDPYFGLGIKLTNVGTYPARFTYLYADEPWVGDYGTSAGDVGWVEGNLVYSESFIDPRTHHHAGFADRGNPMIGEKGEYTGVANFIDWPGYNPPDYVYFANNYNGFDHPPEFNVPLSGDARSLGLVWDSRLLNPGESQKIHLRLGIAAVNPASGLPSKPPLRHLPNF